MKAVIETDKATVQLGRTEVVIRKDGPVSFGKEGSTQYSQVAVYNGNRCVSILISEEGEVIVNHNGETIKTDRMPIVINDKGETIKPTSS